MDPFLHGTAAFRAANIPGKQVPLIPLENASSLCLCQQTDRSDPSPAHCITQLNISRQNKVSVSHLFAQPRDGRTLIMTQLSIYLAENIGSQRWKYHFHIPQWP